MTSYTTFRQLADAIGEAAQRYPYDSKLRKILTSANDLAKQAWEREQVPLVFDMSHTQVTHTVEVGRFGSEKRIADPHLAGLWAAWRIFSFRQGANGMDASTFLERPSSAPGEALRKQLSRAAEWVEVVAHCPELARAFLKIKTTGDVITIRGDLPEIHLML